LRGPTTRANIRSESASHRLGRGNQVTTPYPAVWGKSQKSNLPARNVETAHPHFSRFCSRSVWTIHTKIPSLFKEKKLYGVLRLNLCTAMQSSVAGAMQGRHGDSLSLVISCQSKQTGKPRATR